MVIKVKNKYVLNIDCILIMSTKKPKGLVRKRDKFKTAYAIPTKTNERLHSQYVGDQADSTPYPSFKSHLVAPWTKGEPDMDNRLRLKEQYMREGEKWGELHADERDLQYLQRIKEKEEYAQYIKFATAIPDPERPETQQLLRNVAPEIIDLPEKNHRESVGIQKKLRAILTNGIVDGPDDHKFMFQICRADSYLPLWPIWDPCGDLIISILVNFVEDGKNLTVQDFHQVTYLNLPEVANTAKQRGIFNPIRWGYGDTYENLKASQTKMQHFQIALKAALFRKLYKGLKSMDDKSLWQYIMAKPSVLTGVATTNNPYSLYKWAAKDAKDDVGEATTAALVNKGPTRKPGAVVPVPAPPPVTTTEV